MSLSVLMSVALHATADTLKETGKSSSTCDGWETFCFESFDSHPLGVLFEFFILFYAFIALATVCDDYLVPSLETLCVRWNVREDVAGATFMAFGSAAPEVVINAVGTLQGGESADTGIAAITGSGMIAFMVVPALCILLSGQSRPLQIKRRPLARDVIFYVIAVICMLIFMRDGVVNLGESLVLVSLYVVYIISVVVSPKIRKWYQLRQLVGEERIKFLNERSMSFVEKARLERSESRRSQSTSRSTTELLAEPLLNAETETASLIDSSQSVNNDGTISATAAARQSQLKSTAIKSGSRRLTAKVSDKAAADAAVAGRGKSRSLASIEAGYSDDEDDVQEPARPDAKIAQTSTASDYVPPTPTPAIIKSEPVAIPESAQAEKVDEAPSATSSETVKITEISAEAIENPEPVAEVESQSVKQPEHVVVTAPDVAKTSGDEVVEIAPVETKTDSATEVSQATTAPSSSSKSSVESSLGATGRSKSSRKSVTFMAEPVNPPSTGAAPAPGPTSTTHECEELSAVVEGGVPVYSETRYVDEDGGEADGGDGRDDEERLSQDEIMPLEEVQRFESMDDDEDDEEDDEPTTPIGKFIHTIATPLRFIFSKTIPNTRLKSPKESWYPLGFFCSFLWVAFISMVISAVISRWGSLSGIAQAFLGVAVVSVGAEIPDVIQSVTVARRGYGSMAVSNCIGSQITNVLVGLGVPWTLSNLAKNQPVEVPGKHRIFRAAVILLIFVVIFFTLMVGIALYRRNNKVQLARWKGFVTIGCYFVGIAVFSGLTLCTNDWC